MQNELEENELQKREKKLTAFEKLMLRLCFVFIILISGLISFSSKAYNILEENDNAISKISTQVAEQISLMDSDLNTIKIKTEEYARMIENVKTLTEIEEVTNENRMIPKDSIPNMLSRIMNLIPRQVKILSIANVEESKKILIEVESEKYEQLGYFSSILKTENVLKNIKSTSGSKEGSVVKVTIEGELP